jgi:hypothetical protein
MAAPSSTDHQLITEAVYRYGYGIDTRDWVLYRSIFTDEIDIDFTSYNDAPASHMRADDWVTRVTSLFTGLDATQHTMTNPLVTIHDDADDGIAQTATCQMYMQAAHALDRGNDEAWFTIGGYYTDRLRRIGDVWMISAVTLTVLWRRGDASIMTSALTRGASRPGSNPKPSK